MIVDEVLSGLRGYLNHVSPLTLFNKEQWAKAGMRAGEYMASNPRNTKLSAGVTGFIHNASDQFAAAKGPRGKNIMEYLRGYNYGDTSTIDASTKRLRSMFRTGTAAAI